MIEDEWKPKKNEERIEIEWQNRDMQHYLDGQAGIQRPSPLTTSLIQDSAVDWERTGAELEENWEGMRANRENEKELRENGERIEMELNENERELS